MKDVLKNILFALVIFIVLVSLFSGAADVFKKEKVISLSELALQVKENQVKKALISGDKVALTLADNSAAVVYKEPSGSFLDSLKNLGVPEKNISALDIQVKTESGLGYFLINILPVILPFLLILPGKTKGRRYNPIDICTTDSNKVFLENRGLNIGLPHCH